MRAYIEKRQDEIKHGVFVTTYVVYDMYGRWRGDYATWQRAVEKRRELNENGGL